MAEKNSKSNSARQPDLENRVSVIETKVDMFIQEMRDFKAEMRDRDNQRAEETRVLKAETDARFARIEAKLDSIDSHSRNLAVTAMIGIGAMGAAVIGIAYSVMTTLLQK